MRKYRVIKSRKCESSNPIKQYAGDKVILGEESNEDGDWAGWILCKGQNNEGWIPKQIIKKDGDVGLLLEDYDATEFDLEMDETIIMEQELNGWIWGVKQDAPYKKGWAPLNHLEVLEE